jgi:hypothetical protein
MNDELDAFTGGNAYLEQTRSHIGADQHDEIVMDEDSHGIAMSMEYVVVADPCLRALARITGSCIST